MLYKSNTFGTNGKSQAQKSCSKIRRERIIYHYSTSNEKSLGDDVADVVVGNEQGSHIPLLFVSDNIVDFDDILSHTFY